MSDSSIRRNPNETHKTACCSERLLFGRIRSRGRITVCRTEE